MWNVKFDKFSEFYVQSIAVKTCKYKVIERGNIWSCDIKIDVFINI